MARKASRRGEILAAAARIVQECGAAHLTIDAVAERAGVSKGGVLYHFPSKQALLEGMLGRLLEQLQAREAAFREAHSGEPDALLASFIVAEHDQPPAERAMSRAILAAAAENPELLAPARQLVKQTFADVGRASNPSELGWIALLATQGLRFLEMLSLLPLTRTERERVHQRLLELAREISA
ncbi:MAG: TetR/AcrR family transcriptional regulator [Pseudomonadales bacterium]